MRGKHVDLLVPEENRRTMGNRENSEKTEQRTQGNKGNRETGEQENRGNRGKTTYVRTIYGETNGQ